MLDFGVIVLGAEAARLFADQGAEVIKVESRAFPDGARVSPVHFAIGHRGSRSVGVNLRSAEGVEVVKRLVAESDVVLANFKPGTLEKLGLGPRTLHEINPGIVIAGSSAVGATGPWSSWMGYGPLVRCASGLTSLWRYPDDAESFSDSTTIHPDHYAARVTAITALAALIARRRVGPRRRDRDLAGRDDPDADRHAARAGVATARVGLRPRERRQLAPPPGASTRAPAMMSGAS